jgi:hypothetical protein
MSVTAPEHVEKQPSEKRSYTMDFSNLMATGETIESDPAPSVVSEKRGGGASDLTISDVTISGQTLTMWIEGGTHASVYRIEASITTSTGQELEGDGILKIRDK